MKKKLLVIFSVIGCILLVGCGKSGEKDVLKNFAKKINESKSYHLVGELELINNEDSYSYDVDVAYEKDEKFRVSLKNKTNNHEQIILKNEEGVYVLTPSLNKSFKFQSEWPYNNSQSYLLQTLLSDIENDSERILQETDNGYMFTTKVNYANNKELVKQNIYLDKDYNVSEVHVLNDKEQVTMKMKFKSIDLKATYDENYFTLKGNMSVSSEFDTTAPVFTIDEIIYPMYMPENTYLSAQDKVSKESGERIILTFSGDTPFMFVQETATVEEQMTTVPMYGEPVLIADTVGALSDSSVTWISNGVEYYVVSDVMSETELLSVAQSISVMPVSK